MWLTWIYNFPLTFFCLAAWLSGICLILDVLLSSVIFFFSGKYQSVLEQSTHCNFWWTPDLSFINGLCYKAMPGTGWSLESPFLGLNAIVNSFWRFQHETINILYIFCISGIIGIILLFIVVNLIDPDDYYLNHNLNPNIPILIYYPCFLLL